MFESLIFLEVYSNSEPQVWATLVMLAFAYHQLHFIDTVISS